MCSALTLLLNPSVNAKAWYLWCFASYVSVGPFLNIFFQAAGLSSAQIGVIGALRPWISAPASFAWAALADRLHAHRAVLLATFTAAVGMRMLLLLPRSFSGLLAVVLVSEVLRSPASVLADTQVIQHICEKDADYGKYRLWGAVGWGTFSTAAGWLITHLGIRWSFYAQAILTLPCLFHGARLFAHTTTTRSKQGHVGQSRQESGLHAEEEGAMLSAAPGRTSPVDEDGARPGEGDGRAASEVDAETGEAEPLIPAQENARMQSGKSHRTTSLTRAEGHISSSCTGAAGGNGKGHDTGTRSGPEGNQDYWHKLLMLARRVDVLVFFATAITMGYGFGTIDSFLFLHLKQLGATETLMGLTLTVTCAAEVPAFHLQDRLLERWGVTRVLDLVHAVYAIRMALYAVLPYMGSVLWVLPVEVLHGVTFACGWGAGTVNCKLLAPSGLAATMQGTFQGLYFGAGYGLGSLVGGWVGSRVGWQGMFACASATMLVFWFIVVVWRWIIANRHSEKSYQHVELLCPANP